MLSLWIYDVMSKIYPLGRTASKPKIWDLKDPCLITYFPPAFVDAFPPIWQEPFAPKSRGISQSCSNKYSLIFSKIAPAWQVTTELKGSNF